MPCSVCKTVPDAFVGVLTSVTTSATKAVAVPARIGAVAPELNTVAAVTAPPVAKAVTPAFFTVVHPTRQQVARTTSQKPSLLLR